VGRRPRKKRALGTAERREGDYYDTDGKYLGNDGIDDNKVYTVNGTSKFSLTDFGEGGKYHNNEAKYNENNGDNFWVNYEGNVAETKLTFTGSANAGNSKQADGQINLIQTLENGKEFTMQSIEAVGGPFGNGAPPNGNYTVNGGRLRTEEGYRRDGFGFSFNVEPTFQTGRSLLRIHPDGNLPGTLGCVGLKCSAIQGKIFYNQVNAVTTNGSINLNINIEGNPNNQGGGFVPNNGE